MELKTLGAVLALRRAGRSQHQIAQRLQIERGQVCRVLASLREAEAAGGWRWTVAQAAAVDMADRLGLDK